MLSKDEQIRRNPLEREAVQLGSVKAFFLTQQGLSDRELGEIFVKALPGMVRRTVRQSGLFIFTVSRSGVFSRVL